MRVPGTAAAHLTYSTNMHPGETWAQVFDTLQKVTVPIRQRVSPDAPFGLGLWLSDRASLELVAPQRLNEFRAFCAHHGLYVFTINGFPFGGFHRQRVKEDVFRPDWGDPRRLAYTNRLADILAALVPPGMEGSISTVPCSFKAFIRSEDPTRRILGHLIDHVIHLARIRDDTGTVVHLGLEPEPLGLVENCDEVIQFFQQHVFGEGVRLLMRATGWNEPDALACVRRHLGICYDTCHQAVQYEEPADALARLSRAGIRVSKLQISSAVQAMLPETGTEATLAELERFVEPTYLHQVIESRSGALRRYPDLAVALAAARAELAAGHFTAREWRVHFHVPVFLPRVGRLATTRDHIERTFAALASLEPIQHLEIETYTWDVLPPSLQAANLVDAVVREFAWVLSALRTATTVPTAAVPKERHA
ncbi:MAG TPA: metabolite traffic protein EboE [Candidatus Baltobacteraceae bacterium]|nr:metabolite traffic protein EboE [Candidatus Baltobacteraceae bacterium]